MLCLLLLCISYDTQYDDVNLNIYPNHNNAMVFIKLALRTIFWYFINVIFYYSDYFSLYYILYICFTK